MATYYRPPRQHAPTDNAASTQDTRIEDLTELDVGQSIYIFPTPSSLPASPGGSSTFSAPSDLTDYSTISSGTRSRDHSFSSSIAGPSSSPERRRSRRSPLRRSTIASAASDPEVEVWDWTADTGDELTVDEARWEFEADIERAAAQWGFLSHDEAIPASRPTAPAHMPPFRTHELLDHHFRQYMRSRTQSNTSSLTTYSVGSSRDHLYTPQPRIRIPLLSFITSLLSIDLDDPAARCISQSSGESILFPGQSGLLGPIPEEEASGQNDTHSSSTSSTVAEASRPHGIIALLTDSSKHSVNVMKDGLAVLCETPYKVTSPLSLPGLSAFSGLYRLVGEAYSQGSRVWLEARSNTVMDI